MSDGDRKSKPKKRDVNDPLEAMKMIVNENPGLKARVINKLKLHFASGQKSLLEEASSKKPQKRNENDD